MRESGGISRRTAPGFAALRFALVVVVTVLGTLRAGPASAAIGPPTLRVTAGDMANGLSWDKPVLRPGARVYRYRIWRSTSTKGTYLHVGSTSVSSRHFTDRVAVAAPYFYRVRAVAVSGKALWSSPVARNASVKMKKLIGPSGGTLRAANGEISLSVPAGAIAAPVPISVVESAAGPASTTGTIRVAGYYDFSPGGMIFSAPVSATVRYRVPVRGAESARALAPGINLVTYDEGLGVWQPNLTTVDTAAATFTGPITHFSYWTGGVTQPHGTPPLQANYCVSVCHPNVASPVGWDPRISRDNMVCFQCHGNELSTQGPAGTSGPNIESEFIDSDDQSFEASTQSRHPVPEEGLWCSACHNQHRKPNQYSKLLRALDAATGFYVQAGKNQPYVGSAYCWTCHGTASSASVDASSPGYYARSGGDHKTLMASTPHETAITAPTSSGIRCLKCHTEHASVTTSLISTQVAGQATANDKTLCEACHPSASAGYPTAARVSTESINAGYPISGTWPGKVAYSASAHTTATVKYPGSDNAAGACTNCHGPHGTGRADMLSRVYDSPKSYETSQSHGAYALCIGACHDSNGPGSNIAASYESTATFAGHKISYNSRITESSDTTYLPQGSKLPCYECHNPHGSQKGNYKMFPDKISSDPSSSVEPTVTGQRSFCTRCHRTSDSLEATPTLAGMSFKRLPSTVTQHETSSTTACLPCHGGNAHVPAGHGSGSGSCGSGGCHGTSASHVIHTSASDRRGPAIDCADCHGEGQTDYGKFADGQPIGTTTVCDTCHSPGGTFDGVTSQATTTGPSIGAKGNWSMSVESTIYNAAGTDLRPGKEKWCVGCHDSVPSQVGSQVATDKAGNNSTYGYFAAGHGKASAFARMSWQDTAASGNGAANQTCTACHDTDPGNAERVHIRASGSSSRLKVGYEDDAANSNCKQCHNPGTVATSTPAWYTTYSAYSSSAHSTKKCSDCHDVHAAPPTGLPTYAAMTKKQNEDLCNQSGCHAGAGGHPGVGSTSFTVGGKNYTLECASCHNVHVVTGTYAQAGQNKSPVTRFSADTTRNLEPWGDVAGEKMDAYAAAGGGQYRTPKNEPFTGAQLPDYATFCSDCHREGGPTNVPFGINWGADPHGRQPASEPNGYGTCPNWFACGLAFGWEGDDRTATDENDSWPVIPRGAGDQLFSREAYTHTDRIKGDNFTLSCTDCHTGHGTGNLGRSNVNGGSFTSNWNSMCNNCHYYYSDWHAGMSCGNASCHISERMNTGGVGSASTPHQMTSSSGSGGTRIFDPSLVLWYKFDNDLKDSSNTWQMDGKWYSTSGSFAAGKFDQAAVLGEDVGVQVGTENDKWSTDGGYHGTWVYTEMKKNTSLEAWVYPTDNAKGEYTIFNKHVGYSNGGYGLSLKKIAGTLRAALNMQADNNGVSQGGAAGIRGAYSSVAVPLNKWTHIAATFDTSGPARNPANPSVGRIRIYVNGEDKTTSDSSGNNMQPSAGEDSIFAHSENSSWNEGICYDGNWCASEFSVGGFDWESTNYIGRIDNAKVWNVSKDTTYFASYDSQAGPSVSLVEGMVGSDKLNVTFSEGVYTNTGGSGALVPGDFALTDTDNSRTISSVTHTAGSSIATVTLSAPLDDSNDINNDTLAAASNAIYDEYNNACDTATVTVTSSPQCPSGQAKLQLNETSTAAYVSDEETKLSGKVYGSGTLTGSQFNGDGANNYIDFEYNSKCLQADTSMTIDTKIYPKDTSGTAQYVKRIMARDGGANWQISVWRNNGVAPWTNFNASSDKVAIALWVNPADNHGGNAWKPVLTEVSGGSEDTTITGYRWYRIKAIWNTNKTGGTPGQPFVPAEIWVDDRGPNDDNIGQRWSGWKNATDADQSQFTDAVKLYTGDTIKVADGAFTLGANVSNHANNVFKGKIDYFYWQGEVDEYRDDLAILPLPEAPSGIEYLAFLADRPGWGQDDKQESGSGRNIAVLALALAAIAAGSGLIFGAKRLDH